MFGWFNKQRDALALAQFTQSEVNTLNARIEQVEATVNRLVVLVYRAKTFGALNEVKEAVAKAAVKRTRPGRGRSKSISPLALPETVALITMKVGDEKEFDCPANVLRQKMSSVYGHHKARGVRASFNVYPLSQNTSLVRRIR